MSVATTAEGVVNGDRAAAYGNVLDDFGRTADLWTALFRDYLKPGKSFKPEDVPAAMRMVKESRLRHSPRHEDSLIDICGYALTQEKVWLEQARRSHDVDVLIEELHAARPGEDTSPNQEKVTCES